MDLMLGCDLEFSQNDEEDFYMHNQLTQTAGMEAESQIEIDDEK